MDEHTWREGSSASADGRLRRTARGLARDYAYVMPGFPLALVSFCLLIPMLAVSVGLIVVWIGLVLLPLTLLIASGFAQFSRTRLALWGAGPAAVTYRRTERGILGPLRIAADPRRWLDFVFETLVALPLRLFTFCLALTWTVGTAAGLTYWSWIVFIPGDDQGWAELMRLGLPELAPQTALGSYVLDSGLNLLLGLIFLLTLPPVMRGLATLDTVVTEHLLGTGTQTAVQVPTTEPARATAGSPDAATSPARSTRGEVSSSGASLTVLTWAVTAFFATVLVAVAWPILASGYGVHPALAMLLTVTHSASAILTVRWARVGAGVSIVALLGQQAATAPLAETVLWPWQVTALLTQVLVIGVIALRRPWIEVAATWAALLAVTLIVPVLFTGGIPAGSVANSIVALSVLAGIGLVGALLRLWGLSLDRIEVAEQLSAHEAQRRRGLEERHRIVRELHDVVAHSMSVISVQAGTAKYRRTELSEPVQQEFDDIAASSRQALSEMRALLGLLRGDDDVPTAPVPGLPDIADLVEATRASGVSISYAGQTPTVSATLGLTVFRAVQEALSNALRHAPESSIEVTVRAEETSGRLVARVVNSAPQTASPASPSSGLGLSGIRERVAALDGTVSAGPTAEGGFALEVSLPLNTPDETAEVPEAPHPG